MSLHPTNPCLISSSGCGILDCRVPQVSLVLRDLGVATSVMSIALFLRHFGSPVVDVVLAQVSQQRRDLGHPAGGGYDDGIHNGLCRTDISCAGSFAVILAFFARACRRDRHDAAGTTGS